MATPKLVAKQPAPEPTGPDKIQLPVPVDPPADEHPHQNLDRAIRAALAHMTGGLSPYAAMSSWSDWALHLARAPGRQLELAERAQINALKLASYAASPDTDDDTKAPFQPRAYDHRFTHPSWSKPPYNLLQQNFLAAQDWWDHALSGLRGVTPQHADRNTFMMRQMLDMVSPSNFPWLNPEIVEATRAQNGQNLIEGTQHFLADMMQTATQSRKPIPKDYQIGKNLACTPGKVVYRNDIFELLQYSPQTQNVKAEPILIIPAWIMKYYILDLSPHNSLINYLVGQGFTVFAISWINPTADRADLSLEDYRIRGVMAALNAVSDIVPDQKIHTCGYCLGGTMLSIAAATMARDGDDRLASITLMAAQTDFTEAGELLLFLDESQVALLEDLMWEQGYLDRPQMSGTFAAIRAEDLIYTRAVRRYFLGLEDLDTDMGVWNGDTTRMPARMHSEYLRGLFLENRLTAGRFAIEGRVIALKDIHAPMFVIGTETDHIAPWRSTYKTKLFTDGDLHFLLTKGGHNGGILSEPGHPRRHYRVGHRPAGALYQDPDSWLAEHDTIPGSWWPEWSRWLAAHNKAETKPPAMGSKTYPVLGPAPGTYVMQT